MTKDHIGLTSCFSDLKHVPTHMGVCSALNPAKLADIFNVGQNHFWLDFINNFNTQRSDLLYNSGIGGALYGINLILDLKSR